MNFLTEFSEACREDLAALRTSLAARVMNVRRPEWDEHPSKPIAR